MFTMKQHFNGLETNMNTSMRFVNKNTFILTTYWCAGWVYSLMSFLVLKLLNDAELLCESFLSPHPDRADKAIKLDLNDFLALQ